MDFLRGDSTSELDRLACRAAASNRFDNEPSLNAIARWQARFGYSHEEAALTIKHHRANLGRLEISDDALEELREGKEAVGHDKESFKHQLKSQRKGISALIRMSPNSSQETASTIYLLKLEGRVSNPKEVQTLLRLAEPLKTRTDEDNPSIHFCRLSIKERTLSWKGCTLPQPSSALPYLRKRILTRTPSISLLVSNPLFHSIG